MTMTKNTAAQEIVRAQNSNEIGLIEEIRKASHAQVCLKGRNLPRLPVLLMQTQKAVSWSSRGTIQHAEKGTFIAAYKYPAAKEGSYFIVRLNEQTAHNLRALYIGLMRQEQTLEDLLYVLPTLKTSERMIERMKKTAQVGQLCNYENGTGPVKLLFKNFKKDTIIKVATNDKNSSLFTIAAGHSYAVVKKPNTDLLTLCLILPQDLHDVEKLVRWNERANKQPRLVERILKIKPLERVKN